MRCLSQKDKGGHGTKGKLAAVACMCIHGGPWERGCLQVGFFTVILVIHSCEISDKCTFCEICRDDVIASGNWGVGAGRRAVAGVAGT